MTTLVQKQAPDFKGTAVVNKQFRDLNLADFKGKYTVLVFYPLDFTFVCPTELIAFSDRIEDFKKLGAEVIGISVDSQYTHLAWLDTPRSEGGLEGLQFPLLSDINKTISNDYGILTQDGVALRGTFIIDGEGIVRSCTINDLNVGRTVDEILRLIEAFQFADEHGEVCPANWTPGEKTMVPDPVKSKDYFADVS
ncbi:MAG: peroxiredoxin [Candidatus Glassbacteria bacterium]